MRASAGGILSSGAMALSRSCTSYLLLQISGRYRCSSWPSGTAAASSLTASSKSACKPQRGEGIAAGEPRGSTARTCVPERVEQGQSIPPSEEATTPPPSEWPSPVGRFSPLTKTVVRGIKGVHSAFTTHEQASTTHELMISDLVSEESHPKGIFQVGMVQPERK